MRSLSTTLCMPLPPRVALRCALAFFLVAFITRLIFGVFLVPAWESRAGIAPTPDAYPTLALSILEQGRFGYLHEAADVTTVRGPGFPLALVPALLLSQDPRWLASWSALFAATGVLALVGFLARRWSLLAALGGGLCAALHPLAAFVTGRVMADEFFAATGLIAVLLMEQLGRREGQDWRALQAAALWAFLALHLLVRTSGLITWISLALAALLTRSWRRSTMIWISLLLVLVPSVMWSIRTSRLEGRPVYLHSLTWFNFWLGEARFLYGPEDVRGEKHVARSLIIAKHAPSFDRDPASFWYAQLEPRETSQIERELQGAALARVAKDPLTYARRFMEGLGLFWIGAETKGRQLQYLIVATPVLLLASLGALSAIRDGRAPLVHRALVLWVIGTWLSYAALLPFARMSVQVLFAASVFVGVGVHTLATAWLRRERLQEEAQKGA